MLRTLLQTRQWVEELWAELADEEEEGGEPEKERSSMAKGRSVEGAWPDCWGQIGVEIEITGDLSGGENFNLASSEDLKREYILK